MTGLVFLHGWGFAPGIWDAYARAFPERPVLLLDAGYFGAPRLDIPDNPGGWIGVGHSQGFARLLAMGPSVGLNWRGLVGFGGFLRFCALPGQPTRESGAPQATLDAMVARLDVDPADVLRRFVRRCGAGESCHAPLDDDGLARLRDGLACLRELDLAAPAPCPPVLLVHAEDDRIVPVALAREAHERLPGSELTVFRKGSHALPFLRPAECLPLVRDFLERHGER